ncbi:hypothetical protein K488DRAFT_9105, partial [Vararia minispora EC-137]
IPSLPWSDKSSAKIWELIGELEKPENFSVYFGNNNHSGDTKEHVHQCISERLFPQWFQLDIKTVSERVKSKINWVIKRYTEHAKKLQKTGSGVDAEQQQPSNNPVQYMDFYIYADGPDEETPDYAKNIWDEIVKDFPFFTRMHHL